MADLVETVAQVIVSAITTQDYMMENVVLSDNLTADYLDQGLTDFGVVARAAIAAVLDDMAEPSDKAILEGHQIWARGGNIVPVWQAMLAQYRKEMLG